MNSSVSQFPWLVPAQGWMENALATGTQIGSTIGNSISRNRQASESMSMQREEMDFRRQQYEDMLPLKIATEEARQSYAQSQYASSLLKIKATEAKAQDAPLLESAFMGMNEAGKIGGREAILNFKPPTFNNPDTYVRFTDTQLKVADAFGKTEEAKRYAMLTNVEKARIADIRNSGVMTEEAKAIALDEVYAAANERTKKVAGTTSATPGSVIYDKATGKVIERVPVVETVETVEKFEAVEPKAARSGDPLFGLGKRDAVEGSPEKTVKTKKAVTPKSDFKSADDVKSAVSSGKLKKEEALEILRSQFGYE